MIKSYATTILLLLTISVNLIAQEKNNKVEVKINRSEVLASAFMQDFKIIKLKTNKNCIISYVRQVFIDDDLIFLSNGNSMEVLVFDLDGNFLRQIGHEGRGPGELINIGDFLVDTSNNQVEILDTGTQKVFQYSYSGEFLKSIQGIFAGSIGKINSSKYVYYSHGSSVFQDNNGKLLTSTIALVSDKGKIVTEYLGDYVPWYKGMSATSSLAFTNYRSELIFSPNMSTTIFTVEEDRLHPRYDFDFGPQALPKQIKSNIKSSSYKKITDYVSAVVQYFETDSYSFFKFLEKRERYYAFMNKSNLAVVTFRKDLFVNDINGIPFEPPIGTLNNNKFVSSINAIDFLEGINNLQNTLNENELSVFRKSNPQLMKVFNQTQDTDNPILVIYSLQDEN